MPAFFLCPHCRKKYRTTGKSLGKRVHCTRCGKRFTATEAKSEALTIREVPQDTDKLPRVESDPEARTVPLQKNPDATMPLADARESRMQPKATGEVTLEAVKKVWHETLDGGVTVDSTLNPGRSVARTPTGLSIAPMRLAPPGKKQTPTPHYELIEMLGEGGMGVVYTARQASLGRTIAMKMIKGEAARSDRHKNLFLTEAAVTGDLEHPNIVPIYDLGADDGGQLFYAMKKVEGTPWDEVIAEKTLAENVDILMRVADAVAFAHSRGVIHRDLKPENVMLGGFGEVLVMDWGLAASVSPGGKAEPLADSGTGGTPSYMAPEMAAGDPARIGTHSDVYLLGAILYEIVTGFKPHTGGSVVECLCQAAQNVIQDSEAEGELVEIARKAMATEPADRYADVKVFQQAIREYQAHSESFALCQKARRDLERARSGREYDLFAQAVFAFRQAWELWQVNDEARRGLREAQLAYAECALSKGDLDLAASQLDESAHTHRSLLKQIEKARHARATRQQRVKLFAGLSLAAGVLILAGAVVAAVLIYREQSRTEAALRLVESERDRVRNEQAKTVAALARVKEEQVKTKAALETAETERQRAEQEALRAKRITEFMTGMLAKANPVAGGNAQYTVGHFLEQASERADTEFAGDDVTRQMMHMILGELFYSLKYHDRANVHLVKAVDLAEKLYGTEHSRYVKSIVYMARIYEVEKKFDAAETRLLEAREILKRLVGEKDPDYAKTGNDLGRLYMQQKQFDKAEPLLRESVSTYAEIHGEDSAEYATVLNSLASLYYNRGEPERAGPLFTKVVAIQKKALGVEHPYYGAALNNLAMFHFSQGEYDKAETLLVESADIKKKVYGPEHHEYANGLVQLGALCKARGALEKAEMFLADAASIVRKSLGQTHPSCAQYLYLLAEVQAGRGRFVEAEANLVDALELLVPAVGEDHAQARRVKQMLQLVRQQRQKTE